MMEVPYEKAPLLCSQRLVLAVMTFFGKFFVYAARVNLSVAILCMVRSDVNTNVTSPGQDVNFTHTDTGQDSNSTNTGMGQEPPMTSDDGEFDWDKSMQSQLLSMYFFGYICTQIAGGWLSSKLGGRRVWGFCQFVSAICTLLTPFSARTNFYFACAVRFVLGFAAGVTFPSVYSLLGRWAPPLERSKLVSYTFSGLAVGMIVTLAVSGFLCEYGFDNGWGSIFYLCGIFHLIWVVVWFYLTADSPEEHPRISTRERDYIQQAIGKKALKRKNRVPWFSMFTSGPVWAIITAHFCTTYISYTLLTSLPMFMKEALKFDIKKNGLLSSLPYLAEFISGFFVGYLADKSIEKGWFRVLNTRRIFHSISLLGPAVSFCVLIQLDSSQRYWAVFLLCMCTSLKCFNRGGYLVNHLDLSPSYAGIMYGITNTAATIPGIIAPIIAGALTPNKTIEEWRNVFYVCVGIAVFGCIVYVSLADAKLQSWAIIKTELDNVLTMDKDYPKQDKILDDVTDTGNTYL